MFFLQKKKTILLGNLKSIRQVLFALFNFESSCWKNHPCLLNNGVEFMPCRKCYKRQRLLQHKLSTSSFINHSNCEVTDSMSTNCKNDLD